MAELAGSFEHYGAWREALAQAIVQFRRWLQDNKLLDAEASRRIGVALDRLARTGWSSPWSPSSRAASPS